MLIELARVGKWGETGTEVTEKDLQEIIETFEGEVPVTLGHQLADYMPAFGWVKSVNYDSQKKTLIGEVELNDLLREAYEQGLYKRWSVGIRRRASDGKAYLHHVAFLGAVPPKIKDLKVLDSQIYFSDRDGLELWVFAEAEKDDGKPKPPKLEDLEIVDREWDVDEARKRVFEKYGIEGLKEYCLYRDPEADPENKTAYKFLVVDIVNGEPKIIAKALSASLAYLHGARGVRITEKVRKVVEPKVKKLLEEWKGEKEEKKMAEELEALRRELADVRAVKEELERKLKQEKLLALKKAVEGKIPNSKLELVLQLADSLGVEEKFEFADENGNKIKKSALDLLVELFNAIPLPYFLTTDLSDEKCERKIDSRELLTKV